MKAKLLKRLRKKAKDYYWIEDHKGSANRYRLRSRSCSRNCCLRSFTSLVEAVELLKEERWRMILGAVDEIREQKGLYKLDI